MWAWAIENFGLEPLIPPNTVISINWQDFIEEIPQGTISGQVYINKKKIPNPVMLSFISQFPL